MVYMVFCKCSKTSDDMMMSQVCDCGMTKSIFQGFFFCF